MKLKFWGVRGSIPAPALPYHVEKKVLAALQQAARDRIDLQDAAELEKFVRILPLETTSTIGGNTTCISLETEEGLIIFDAGSGMRELGRYLMTREFGRGKGRASIFFTHTHWDHIQGFPFFTPAMVPGNHFDIYHIHPYVPDVLRQQMVKEVYPVDFESGIRANIHFHQLQPEQMIKLGNLKISNIELQHPGKAYSYRIDHPEHIVVLATDGEYKNLGNSHTRRYIDFYQDADILIFDAQFSVRESIIKEDWGHSSGLIGADIAQAARVKRLILFHHNPYASDQEIMVALRQTREYLSQHKGALLKVDVAREDWEITLQRNGRFEIKETRLNEAVILALQGQFDAEASEKFTAYVLEMVKSGRTQKIILDLSALDDLDMAGIRALLDARRNVFSLSIVDVPEKIYRVLELAGTTDFFAIYDTVEGAIEVMTNSSIGAAH